MSASFSLLIKPVSLDCNLRCSYCFYLPKAELFGRQAHRMTPEVLEKVTRDYLSLPMETHTFGWQGGEPTLAGLDFFREAVSVQRSARRGGAIQNVLQTNGTLLDDDWGSFLHEAGFLVGISIDGPASLHDRFRLHEDGRGSHTDVLRGLEILKRHRIEHNVLTLVSAANREHPVEVYRYLRDELGLRYHQYIDCVEFGRDGTLLPYSLRPGQWGRFLCSVFDEWYPRDTHTVSIRLFDSIVSRLATGIPTICPMGGDCRHYLVIEHNGDLYPCDFHVRPETLLGNIAHVPLSAVRSSARYRSWGQIKNPRSSTCDHCRYLPLCMGDCPKNRLPGTPRTLLCDDWKLFYDHTIERFELLADEVSRSLRHFPS